jgi:membrane-associated protease RseP (regulator of RpoE activity)
MRINFKKNRLLILLISFTLVACATSGDKQNPQEQRDADDSPAAHQPSVPLMPKGRPYTGDNAPIIQHMLTKSVAEKSGFKVGDMVLSVNGDKTMTAAEFEQKIKRAPKNSTITVMRAGNKIILPIVLGEAKPRFGAGFEPAGVVFTKKASPYIGVLHLNDMTVYAQASATNENELRFNFIIESHKPEVGAPLQYAIYEKNDKQPIISGREVIDALGAEPHIFSKIVP